MGHAGRSPGTGNRVWPPAAARSEPVPPARPERPLLPGSAPSFLHHAPRSATRSFPAVPGRLTFLRFCAQCNTRAGSGGATLAAARSLRRRVVSLALDMT